MDYIKDTGDLTSIEDLAYRRALDQLWVLRGRIPSDPERLRKLLRLDKKEFAAAQSIFPRFFYVNGNSLGNARIDIELARAEARAIRAQENGRTGGRPRNPPGNPDKTQRVFSGYPRSEAKPNPDESSSPSPSDQTSSLRSDVSRVRVDGEGFENQEAPDAALRPQGGSGRRPNGAAANAATIEHLLAKAERIENASAVEGGSAHAG